MLLEEIRKLRERLEKERENDELNYKEILKISLELDKLIAKFQKEKNNH